MLNFCLMLRLMFQSTKIGIAITFQDEYKQPKSLGNLTNYVCQDIQQSSSNRKGNHFSNVDGDALN